MTGKLLLVTGLSGSGKSTLVRAALKALPDLAYLKTYTTRPMRSGEEHSHEYEFVTPAEYDSLRATASSWDHTEYAGFSYGADIQAVLTKLGRGKTIICNIAPAPAIITQIRRLYRAKPVIILIDTPPEIARIRTAADTRRSGRNESLDGIHADLTFVPTGKLADDSRAFTMLVRNIIADQE